MHTNCLQTLRLPLYTPIGEHKLAVSFLHGNVTKHAKEYTRTMTSVLNALKADTTSTKASVVYKKLVASSQLPSHAPTAMPRNMQQVRNIRQNTLHKTRLIRDTLYNIHDIAYDTHSYIFRITTYPDMEMTFGLRGILDLMECILNADQLLSYDTTFQLGDFYVSIGVGTGGGRGCTCLHKNLKGGHCPPPQTT